jgi:hypothetical protein
MIVIREVFGARAISDGRGGVRKLMMSTASGRPLDVGYSGCNIVEVYLY